MPEANFENPACNIQATGQDNHDIGEWALIHKGELAGIYGSVESAWSEAAARFHRRRCLVRPISNFSMTLTVSAENLQSSENRLSHSFQKWTRFTRQLFAAGEMSS
jgi:hypothetical protein